MKTIILTAVCSLTAAVPLLANGTNMANSTNTLTNETLRASYALGMMLGEGWKAHGITDLHYNTVLQGIKDAESGGHTLMTMPEMREALMKYQQRLAKREEKKRKELGAKNLKISDAFLAQNKKKPGIVTLPDGLQYKVIQQGTGPTPTKADKVTVSYVGTLIDGTKFDSSDKATFPLNGIIPGWRVALTHMKVGSEWQLFIPPNLAYGAYGRPPRIEPNSVLLFKLHLLSIEHPKPAKPVTSDIIEVPSAEQMKKGAKVKIIKPEEAEKMQQQSQSGK